MATKRTDAFDVFASRRDRRDADIKALKTMSPHATLKGMGGRVAPLVTAAQGTVPPPVSLQDEEAILLAAETQISHNPLYVEEVVNADDLIELIEESGLLVLDADQTPDDAIEVSSSFLVEDLDGFPAGLQTPALPDHSAGNEDIEEITSNHLAYVETRGEIVEVVRPRLPTADEIPLLNRHNLYNDSAEYSDGIPRLSTQPRGLSSKTLRVPAPRAKGQARGWLWNAAVGLVFIAGIGAGVAFAMHSSARTTPTASPATTPADVADVAALAAPVASAPQAEEVAVPVVAPLGDTESEVAAGEIVEPRVRPLDVESLDLVAEQSEVEAEETAAEVEVQAAAEASAGDQGGPVVTPLPLEPAAEEVAEPAPETGAGTRRSARTKSESDSRPRRSAAAAEPATNPTKNAIINAGSALPSADPGVLMLAAKPPCEIRIDGKTTGLTTPQRVLKLAPGNHRITLTNQEHQIKDSFKVSIVSGKKTRIVRDNTSKIK